MESARGGARGRVFSAAHDLHGHRRRGRASAGTGGVVGRICCLRSARLSDVDGSNLSGQVRPVAAPSRAHVANVSRHPDEPVNALTVSSTSRTDCTCATIGRSDEPRFTGCSSREAHDIGPRLNPDRATSPSCPSRPPATRTCRESRIGVSDAAVIRCGRAPTRRWRGRQRHVLPRRGAAAELVRKTTAPAVPWRSTRVMSHGPRYARSPAERGVRGRDRRRCGAGGDRRGIRHDRNTRGRIRARESADRRTCASRRYDAAVPGASNSTRPCPDFTTRPSRRRSTRVDGMRGNRGSDHGRHTRRDVSSHPVRPASGVATLNSSGANRSANARTTEYDRPLRNAVQNHLCVDRSRARPRA